MSKDQLVTVGHYDCSFWFYTESGPTFFLSQSRSRLGRKVFMQTTFPAFDYEFNYQACIKFIGALDRFASGGHVDTQAGYVAASAVEVDLFTRNGVLMLTRANLGRKYFSYSYKFSRGEAAELGRYLSVFVETGSLPETVLVDYERVVAGAGLL